MGITDLVTDRVSPSLKDRTFEVSTVHGTCLDGKNRRYKNAIEKTQIYTFIHGNTVLTDVTGPIIERHDKTPDPRCSISYVGPHITPDIW